jgi:hypothetical protein
MSILLVLHHVGSQLSLPHKYHEQAKKYLTATNSCQVTESPYTKLLAATIIVFEHVGLNILKHACNETNLLHNLSSVYSVTISLYFSGLPVAHHQEVTIYIYVYLVTKYIKYFLQFTNTIDFNKL